MRLLSTEGLHPRGISKFYLLTPLVAAVLYPKPRNFGLTSIRIWAIARVPTHGTVGQLRTLISGVPPSVRSIYFDFSYVLYVHGSYVKYYLEHLFMIPDAIRRPSAAQRIIPGGGHLACYLAVLDCCPK
jgi:hypothetical protein